MNDAEPIVIRSSRRRTIPVVVGSVVFVAVGIALVSRADIIGVAIGSVTLLFFGGGLLVLLWSLARPPALLTINGVGVRPGGRVGSQRPVIPWDEIEAVRVYRFHAAALSSGIRMLGLVPRHPDAPIWTSGRMRRINTSMSGLPVSISDRNLSIELEELAELMRRFRPDLPIEYGEPRAAGLGKLTPPPTKSP